MQSIRLLIYPCFTNYFCSEKWETYLLKLHFDIFIHMGKQGKVNGQTLCVKIIASQSDDVNVIIPIICVLL